MATIDKNSKQIGKYHASHQPNSLFLSCFHPVYAAVNKRCHAHKHKLDAGTGGGNDKTQFMIYIALLRFIGKGSPFAKPSVNKKIPRAAGPFPVKECPPQ